MIIEQEANFELRRKLSELREKWLFSLFRQEYGFDPTEKVRLLGNAEQSYKRLVKAHWLEITKNKLLNNRFTNYFKKNYLK